MSMNPGTSKKPPTYKSRGVEIGLGGKRIELWECWSDGCEEIATGLYYHHSGAADRACAKHAGVCHVRCWPGKPTAAVTVDRAGEV